MVKEEYCFVLKAEDVHIAHVLFSKFIISYILLSNMLSLPYHFFVKYVNEEARRRCNVQNSISSFLISSPLFQPVSAEWRYFSYNNFLRSGLLIHLKIGQNEQPDVKNLGFYIMIKRNAHNRHINLF